MLSKTTVRLYERQADVLQAVAHPIRVAIADHLAHGERCVHDIAKHVGANRSNISRHLALMRKAGVVDSRKDGLMVYYWLRTPCILNFLRCASTVLRHNLAEDNKVLAKS